ncbi:MAG: hypothetical protein GF350_06390 [Chitinivibrionales bacterium]|nr:hypothetical protein [Chitinivibrionales bacterium]
MAKNTKEIGYSGLSEWSGRIQEDFLRDLRGKRGYKRYNEMRLNSPVVGAMLLAIEQSIRGISWDYVSDEGADDPRLEFLNDAKKNMSWSWNDHIVEALTMLPFGYAPFEIVYERRDGRMTWRKFAFRGQDTLLRWELDEAGGMVAFLQSGAPDYKPRTIPIDKMVIYRTRVEKNNPEGRSILRTAWIPYYYAKNLMQIEAIGVERDLAGLPAIWLPEGADTDDSNANSDASKANKLVRNVRNDEQAGLVFPPDWKFDLVSSGGKRNFDTDKIIRRYESRILMSALAQFLNLGQDRVGTQALSGDLTDFWAMSVNATADIISDTHTKFAAKKLLRLNGMDAQGIRMEHSPAGDVDLGALGEFFKNVGSKITWLPSDEIWLRGVANLPEADVETIEEEREKNPSVPPQFQFDAEHFEAGRPPDDWRRKRQEKRLERLIAEFFEEQKARVLEEVAD